MSFRVIPITIFVFLILVVTSCSNSLAPDLNVNSGTTSIHFSLPEALHVKVWVENSYQTKVITVVNEHLEAGSYNFPFEMKDANSDPLPYGLYTVRIKSKTFSLSRPLLYQPQSR